MCTVGCLTAPQGPVRHWWDWLRGRLFLALAFGEDGKGRESLERDGHWDIAQSCSVVGRSSGSHSLAFTSWSLMTHSTCRVVFPWPQVTEHWKDTHKHTVNKDISHQYNCMRIKICMETDIHLSFFSIFLSLFFSPFFLSPYKMNSLPIWLPVSYCLRHGDVNHIYRCLKAKSRVNHQNYVNSIQMEFDASSTEILHSSGQLWDLPRNFRVKNNDKVHPNQRPRPTESKFELIIWILTFKHGMQQIAVALVLADNAVSP